MAYPEFPSSGGTRRLRSTTGLTLAVLLATTALGVVSAHAADATWNGGNLVDPNEWTEPANWSPTAVPDGTATFTNAGQTTVNNDNGIVVVGTMLFTPSAQAYTFNFNNPVILNGSGIINNSNNLQIVNVSSGNSLVFQNGASASGGGGTGGVTINNIDGFVAFQNTSSAGSATILNAGILTFSDSSTAGAASITNNLGRETDFFDASSAGTATITNNGILTFNNTATASASTITSNGDIFFNNTSSGGNARFIINAGGTFDISALSSTGTTAGSIEGAGSYVLGSKTLTTGGNNASTTVDGVISGTGGGLTKVGTGTMTLTNTNTYTGATTVSAGTLALSGGGSIASSSVVTVNATFDISASAFPFNLINTLAGNASGIVNMGGNGLAIGNGSTEFAGVIQGTGGFEVIAGTQTLSGVNTYSNATQIDAGATLALKGAGSIASSGFVGFSPGGPGQIGTLDISQTNAGASVKGLFDFAGVGVVALGSRTLTITSGSLFAGVIQDGGIGAGAGGNLAIANGATQSLAGTNTYTGVTTIAAGGELDLTLFAGKNGSIATSSGVTNNGVFDIASLASGTSIKSLSGTGVVNLGSNMLTITNANGNFAGVIQDGGGAGNLALAGGTQVLSGINTYTGTTTVNGGKLVVDGSISSLAVVNAGGTLAGSGAVASTQIAGGTLAPGSAASTFGPLTVQGNLTFTAASTYMIQADPANAARTNVTGTATLGNATVSALFAPGTYVNRQYTILNATGGRIGTFNPTVVSSNSNLQGTLTYDPNNVFLNIKLVFVAPAGLSTNQQNVANTLTNYFNTTGSIPANFALLNAAGLTVASGELGTGVIQSSIKADDLFLNLLLDPTIAGRAGGFAPAGSASRFASEDDASAYAEKRLATPSERAAFAMATKAPLFSPQPLNRWSVWGAGYGGSANVSGNATVGSQDTTARVWGVVGGADYKISPDSLIGFAVAGGGTNYSLANALGSGRADLFQAGVFGRHNFGPAYVSAALAYGWHDVTTNRTVALAGFDQLQGRFQAETFSARFEGGYRFATPFVGITPYAAAQVISFRLPSYAEQAIVGTPQFALNYASQTTTATRTELGLRTDKSWAMQDAMLTLRGRAAWAHDYNPDRSVTALFQSLPGTSFVVNGARGNPDAALLSAGAEVKWLNGFSLAGTFEGEFSGNTTSYAGKGVAKYSW